MSKGELPAGSCRHEKERKALKGLQGIVTCSG